MGIITVDNNRICRLKGTPREIGFNHGCALKDVFEEYLHLYVEEGLQVLNLIDMEKLRCGALPWLRKLPLRFQEEIEGMSDGSRIPLERLAQWWFSESCFLKNCSAFVCEIDGKAWIGRNNDAWLPDLWGYTIIREVEGRLPTMTFGLQGDVFTATGVNRERLWLHANALPTSDAPAPEKPHLDFYVFIPEALETCRTISDVENLLNTVDRIGGMNLFIVDGKTNEFVVFECACSSYARRNPSHGRIVATNHSCSANECIRGKAPSRSERRFNRIEVLLEREPPLHLPDDLIRVLADKDVEQRREAENFWTVYANIACPNLGLTWFTYGGPPAASQGAWHKIDWPWHQN